MYNVAAYVRDHEAGRDPKLPKGQLVTGGILLGLLYLTDTIFFWFAPLAIAWVFWLFGSAGQMGRRRWKAILMFAGWFAILALPLMFRYTRLGVNPIFGLRTAEVWMDTPNHYPGDLAYRLMPGELIASPSLFKAVVAKIILGVGSIIEGYPAISGSWILAFFPTMLLFLSILIGVLLFGVGNNVHSKMPLFVSTLPTMLAFAVAYLLYLIRQAQMRWQGLSITAALLAIAIVLPLGNAMFLKKKQKDITHEATAAQGFAKEIARQKADTAFSDMPQVVAWYANRPAIYIPQNDIQIRDLRNRFKNARYLFLTENVPTFGEEWRPLYQYFQQWNELCAVKRLANEPLPPRQGLFNTAQTGKQFLMALDGFYSIEPVKGGKRVVILASNGPVGTPAPGATPANAPPPGTPGQSTAGGTGPSRSADVRTP
jgi:hypothetical protein